MEEENRFIKGHFLSYALAIGIPVGVPLGVIFGNIVIGILASSVISLFVGFILERNYNTNPITPSKQEAKKKRIQALILVIFGIVAMGILALMYFFLIE